ncbi:MAG: InlB B-repeat-containing protein [Nitrososphaeria archaeon]
MKKRSVSSVIAGTMVIGIALASIFLIYTSFLGGMFWVSKSNQQSQYLLYKSEELLVLSYSGSNLTVFNSWTHPSTITALLEINPNEQLTSVPESIEIMPHQNYTFVDLLRHGWKYAVLTFYGNEFWAPFGMQSPANEMLTLTMAVYGAGQTSPAVGTYTLPYGTAVNISATPNYQFLHWQGTGYRSYSGTSASAKIYMWSNITETAYFGFKITFSAEGLSSDAQGNVLVANGNSYTYSQFPVTVFVPYGQSLSYAFYSPVQTATNGERYVWSSTSGLDNVQSGTFTPAQSGNITGAYERQYFLLTNANPPPGGSVSPSPGWYNAGTQVQTSAIANPGYQFSSWSGSGPGSYSGTGNPASVVVNGPVNETANFNVEVGVYNTYGGSAVASYNGKTYSSNATFYVPCNAQVTFSATANPGYFFSGWSGTYSGSGNPVTLISPASETAEFGYYINFSVSGMNSSAQGAVLTIDGNPYSYLQLPAIVAVPYGQSVSYSFSSPVLSSIAALKYAWVSTAGLDNRQSGTFTPARTGSVVGVYQVLYTYYINQSGIPKNGPDWSVTVNGQTYTEPPTSTVTVTSTTSKLQWAAYNASAANGALYYPSPNSGPAYPGTTVIKYHLAYIPVNGTSSE